MDINEVIEQYKSYGNVIDEEKVRKAIDFAIKYHGTQSRASGEPYYYHPLQVADVIAKLKLDTDSIVTAILHDTLEDTELTFEEIEEHFGYDVAKLVDGVTKLTKIEFKAENIRQAENFHKLLLAMSTDIRVLLIKLADRLHNMRTIDFINSPEKRTKIALETVEIYVPLAEMIGVHQIKEELQDICFRLLHPEARASILNRFQVISADKDQFIDKIKTEIKDKLIGIVNVEVYGRHKAAYSSWIKMKQKNISLDKISDIIAFRVVVDSVTDCYQALGIIHTNYQVIPDSFQDFISTPKSNGYQSIHTGVIALQQKIEVQIRTKEMHDIAEFGVAAHWRYKQGYKYTFDAKKYSWIRRLIYILEQDNNDPEEFLHNTKLTMFYDRIFCFTPKGSLIALPKGATIVDFAYMVHSNIGNYSIGAKVNGIIVPLHTQLNNGDQVKIIISENHISTVSPTWEKFIVTGKARSEISKALRTRKRQQYIELGENIISKALAASGIEYNQEILAKACDVINKDVENLLFAIGEGSISREEVLHYILPKKGKF